MRLCLANACGTSGALDADHAGRCIYHRDSGFFRDRRRLRMGVREVMTSWELVLGGLMAVGLTAYLVYAMLRPEKF
jgi:K+-transporting ATPase KdpF subunit